MELNFVSGPGSSWYGWPGPKVVENKEGAKELLEHIDGIAERNRIEEKIENLNQKFKQWEIQVNETISSLIQQYEEAASKVDTLDFNTLVRYIFHFHLSLFFCTT